MNETENQPSTEPTASAKQALKTMSPEFTAKILNAVASYQPGPEGCV
ncbi:MAG: hypothetical protein KGL63_15170 [Betaproteobacteria bacterium]|nr:hypothetical protein [Betaproteobacteria bacterium]